MRLDIFKSAGFDLHEEYRFNKKYHSYVFRYGGCLVIIDDNFDIEDNERFFFDYSKYCEMQNKYMVSNKTLLRFNCKENELNLIKAINKLIADTYNFDVDFNDNGGSFAESHIDNTPLEAKFEDIFAEAFGSESLECLKKEVSISCSDAKNYFIDYVVETKNGNYAFEENGVQYHHPLIVGKKRYEELLDKQNTIVLLGYNVFRFSTDNLHFKDKTIEELKSFLPSKTEFVPKPIFKNNRGMMLYEHQTDILKQLDVDRLNGKTTSLIVIPTASGKSEICIVDLEKPNIRKEVRRVLIMVPSQKIKDDWRKRIKSIETYYETIDVLFYNAAFICKNMVPQDYYDYIIFDEAHHAQASNCKATIQYFNPKFLIGLTATDERLDRKKLEDIFGSYEVKLGLKEAIDKDIVANIRAYRLESNLNLKDVRFNGKDYNYSDLERTLIIDSRNELIADVLKKYFSPKTSFYKQGIVFCVNKEHTKKIAEMLRNRGLTAEAVYGGNSKNDSAFENYKKKQLQFLCSCQIISEGWDSPQTEIVVMARPTLSKVLYLQQIGRGLRKYEGKECLYLIDVVDNYSSKLTPWNFNSLFHISTYSPFVGVKNNDFDYLSILGLSEHEIAMKEIDILSFEEKYKDYLSLEQAARELYVGTQTLNGWNNKNNYASLYLPIGRIQVPYFSNDDIERIRTEKGLTVHTDETILDDFIAFIDENALTFSFKLVFLISCLKLADKEGNINLTELVDKYAEFYSNRIDKHLPVDKPNCVYTREKMNDRVFVKKSLLDNPFEKFERKRFFFHSKDLNIVSFNYALWSKMTDKIKTYIIKKELQFLKQYYKKYGGYDDEYKF